MLQIARILKNGNQDIVGSSIVRRINMDMRKGGYHSDSLLLAAYNTLSAIAWSLLRAESEREVTTSGTLQPTTALPVFRFAK